MEEIEKTLTDQVMRISLSDIGSHHTKQPAKQRTRKTSATELSVNDISYSTYMKYLTNDNTPAKQLSGKMSQMVGCMEYFAQFRLSILKEFTKNNKLPVSGNRLQLSERIYFYFRKVYATYQVQRVFRGHLVRYAFRARGPGWKRLHECVNDTDCFTLDPIKDINPEHVYTHYDDKGFLYAFNINSLVAMQRAATNPAQIKNPYTRDIFTEAQVDTLNSCCILTHILFPSLEEENTRDYVQAIQLTWRETMYQKTKNARCKANRFLNPRLSRALNDRYHRLIGNFEITTQPDNTIDVHEREDYDTDYDSEDDDFIMNTIVRETNQRRQQEQRQTPQRRIALVDITHRIQSHRDPEIIEFLNVNLTRILPRLAELRSHVELQRADELFMAIDALGNYTNRAWLTDLTQNQLINLFVTISNQWRNMTPTRSQQCIAPFMDPFEYSGLFGGMQAREHLTRKVIMDSLLSAMEILVHTGISDEFRRMGAWQILQALVQVSYDANLALPWLNPNN